MRFGNLKDVQFDKAGDLKFFQVYENKTINCGYFLKVVPHEFYAPEFKAVSEIYQYSANSKCDVNCEN